MRRDNKELFNRLDIDAFKYQEFESSSWGVDIWPMFEAIMLDERVIDRHHIPDNHAPALWSQGAPNGPQQPELVAVPSAAPDFPKRPVASRTSDGAGIFSGYSAAGIHGGIPDDSIGGRGESVRAILGRLAQGAQ